MVKHVSSIVAGAPHGSTSTLRTNVNPARLDEVVAEVDLGDADTMVAACEAARAARLDWAATPAPRRGRVVQQIGRIVEANKQELARLVTDEIGKPYAEALGEVQEIIDTCDFFLGEGRRLYGQTVPSEMRDKQLFTYRMPVGVAAIITAGNFPVAVPSWYLIPALLFAHWVAGYVYFGNSPLLEFLGVTARKLLAPLRPLPLRVGKLDLAPLAGIVVAILGLHVLPNWIRGELHRRHLTIWPQ